MTTTPTNKPVGSEDPRDLYFNAGSLDVRTNSTTLTTTPDRLGVQRKTWHGMEQDFNAFLAASGFELPPLVYVDGSPLAVDRATQVIERAGFLYSAKLPATFPLDLTGNWATDQAALVVRADSSLRQELAEDSDPAKGAALIGYKGRTVYDRLGDQVSAADFGAVGDGVTDDSNALVQFWLSAIAKPGIPHRLEAKTYAISAPLPTINVSNVIVLGEGAEIHDIGPKPMTGTVLKWVGAPGTVVPLLRVRSISGATNQRVSNVTLSGIGVDCNAGELQYGVEVSSVWSCDIDVVVSNAGHTGLTLNVVSELGEAKDLQRCRIRYKGRQIEAASGLSMVLGGDAAANVSMNEIWCDIQHMNVPAIYSVNADNNDWLYVRTLKASGGTATESVSLLGGPSALQSVRAERFHFLTANLPLRAYGTGEFAVGSKNNKIYCLDTENGSPAPLIDPGASVLWQKDTTNLPDTRWASYTPAVSALSGSISTAAASGKFALRGSTVHVSISVTITANGTGSGALVVTLPIAPSSGQGALVVGRERAITGKMIAGYASQGEASAQLQFADGLYPGGNGHVINLSGTYEV